MWVATWQSAIESLLHLDRLLFIREAPGFRNPPPSRLAVLHVYNTYIFS